MKYVPKIEQYVNRRFCVLFLDIWDIWDFGYKVFTSIKKLFFVSISNFLGGLFKYFATRKAISNTSNFGVR